MDNSTLHSLKIQVEQLIQYCDELSTENQALHAQVTELSEDKAILLEKNRIARTKIEMMISRLRAMEIDHE
ncbi:TIGR02449 family protein [Candidatus Albibeggiatoa sp. nov. NOAA]|uniref:TIGR02449 family protein n=1 Tax=Candidatus Albibeggiatoa sp. nov. NOAA TaxID=3162724 RepID=UPI003303BEA0|nr:TIGR02449 family protein [Thiotrichaceae bacterium]